MTSQPGPALPDDLRSRLEEVAKHCRRRRLFRSAIRFGVAAFALAILCTALLAFASPAAPARIAWLALFVAGVFGAAWRWLARPLQQPIGLREAAILIDVRYPDLENRILSAVELGGGKADGASAWMIEQFLRETRIASYRSSFAPLMPPRALAAPLAVAGALALAAGAMIAAFHSLWLPSWTLEGGRIALAPPMEFEVAPGDTRVRAGENVVIQARFKEQAAKTKILWAETEEDWRDAPMEAAAVAGVHYYQFNDMQNPLSYRVQVGDAFSPTYRIDVWTPPEVEAIDLRYTYPEYLGRPPLDVPNGGDITAIEGTAVALEARVNKPLREARIVLSDGTALPLELTQDQVWAGTYVVEQNDSYSIALTDMDGETNEYRPEYKITAQADKAPEIRIEFPWRDLETTSLEEIPFTFEAWDDFGIGEFGIQYEIAGMPPQRIALTGAEPNALETKGEHTLRLEEFDLSAGDLITWTVWADDRKPDRMEFETLADPYFVEIRPFRRLYREAVSNEGGQGQQQNQGQQGGAQGAQAASQKDILIAIWSLRREFPALEESEYLNRRGAIIEAQQQLMQQVSQGGGGMMEGAATMSIVKEMDGVVVALDKADLPDPTEKLTEAAGHAQEAYRLILRNQPEESQIAQRRANSAGGANSQSPDISQLEMQRNRNFYEEERRTSQDRQQAAEEARNRIQELARRQQGVNEEINKLISEMQAAQSEEERRELERRLERLRQEQREAMERLDEADREIASSQMDARRSAQTRQSLQEARDMMNRSLEEMAQDQLQEARTAGARAQSSLQDLEQELRQMSRAAAEQRMNQLREDMNEMVNRQESLLDRLQALKEEQESSRELRTPESLRQQSEELVAEKQEEARQFEQFMEEAAELAAGMNAAQELASRALNDWLRQTSRDGLMEDFERSQALMDYGLLEPAIEQEERALDKLADASERFDEISRMLVSDDLEGMRRALDQLRRLREEQGGPTRDQAASDGEPGERQLAAAQPNEDQQAQDQQAQEGQQGQQRQSGQEGQQSQQGQSGQQRPQDQQGQPGQQSNQGQGQDDSQQRRGSGGRTDDPLNELNRGERGPAEPGGPRDGADTGWGGRLGDDWSYWTEARTPEEMRRFVDEDYGSYIDRLRRAEALLPTDSDYRRELENVRQTIERMRRDYRRDDLTPRFDLYLQAVGGPLAKTAARLEEEIERRLRQSELLLRDEGEIPDQYRKQVADYFETLSAEEIRTLSAGEATTNQ